MSDSIEATRPSEPAPAAVAATQTIIDNHITVVVPPAPRAAAPAVARPKPAPVAPVPPAPAPKPITSAPQVTESNGADPEGHAITRWRDSSGAEIALTNLGQGHIKAEFTDAKRRTETHSNDGGFTGSTIYQDPQFGVLKPTLQYEAADDAVSPFRGDVQCGRNSVRATNNVVDDVTRERIQSFAKDHPELAAKLRASQAQITTIQGTPVTLAQVENTSSQFRACPEAQRQNGMVVEKLTR